MKAAIVEKKGVLKIKDIDIPKIKEDEVLLKVQAASICNATDNHILHGIFDGFHDFYPQILGHEVSGEVVGVGSRVKDVELGEILTLYTPRGAFCEYTIVKPADDLFVKIPKSIPVRVRPLFEMFHGSHVALVYPAQIKGDETALVVGQGPMGLTAAICAKLTAKKVISVDLNELRLQKALEVGIDAVFNRSKMTSDQIVEAVYNETDGQGVDVVIMAISEDRSEETDAFDMAIKCMKTGGRIAGLFVDVKNINENHRLDPHLLLRKEATFCHTLNKVYNNKADETNVFQDVADKVAMGKINLEALITHEVGLSELEYALDLCINHMDETIKVVVYPGDRT